VWTEKSQCIKIDFTKKYRIKKNTTKRTTIRIVENNEIMTGHIICDSARVFREMGLIC
jgi:hypothetical protein